jgi:serine/threonine protein kinase
MPIRPRTLAHGRYTLDEEVGSGGMGAVYRAYDHRDDELRAVKLLSAGMARSTTMRERFRREATMLSRLQHANIVRVHAFEEEGGLAYLVMDYVDGGSLENWVVRNGPMPPRMACGAMLQVCSALAATHAADIVHRDIKPANVLIASDETCRVVDFGIARLDSTSNLTRQGMRMGTIGFMAPEQQISAHDVDHRADVFGVGATLYALLTDTVPLTMETALEDNYHLLPEPVAYLITKATFPQPNQRYDTISHLARVLEHATTRLDPDPTTAAPLYEPVLAPAESQVTGPTIVFED